MNLHRIRKAACGALLLACCAGAATAADGVSVTLTPERAALGKSDDVVLKVTFTNTGSTPQTLLKWRLPFDEIEAPLFDITRDGNPVRYLGMQAKRAAPLDADYLVLQPGASRSARVELSALYDMSVTGAYTVRYRTGSPDLFGKAGVQAQAGELESEPMSIWIDGRLARGTLPPSPLPARGGAGLAFQSCSNAQQDAIASAAAAGLAMSTDAEAYLVKAALAARYGRWFGASDAGRAATLTSHFAAIKDAFENKPVTVDCGCNKPYYAYVYPTQPYVIHVCKAFWPAPMTGTDSKGGTLVHEMSHFNVVAGTNDWVYGQAGASGLANSDPAKAADNADSHEYFGENSPELPVK
jgi:peptidyl-Lys metalloendopeptidase